MSTTTRLADGAACAVAGEHEAGKHLFPAVEDKAATLAYPCHFGHRDAVTRRHVPEPADAFAQDGFELRLVEQIARKPGLIVRRHRRAKGADRLTVGSEIDGASQGTRRRRSRVRQPARAEDAHDLRVEYDRAGFGVGDRAPLKDQRAQTSNACQIGRRRADRAESHNHKIVIETVHVAPVHPALPTGHMNGYAEDTG